MYCGIRTNRKWNYGHVPLLPLIFVSCSLTIEEVGRHSFSSEIIILFYLILINLINYIIIPGLQIWYILEPVKNWNLFFK